MAHEVETMAYANAVPWHGLGTQVTDDLNAEEFLVAAGLNWQVEKRPMVVTNPDGSTFEVPDRFALCRDSDNRFMSVVSTWWHPVQNSEILGFMDSYVRAGGATLETAGSLRNGKVIWALARLGHDFEVTPGDKVRGYLLMTGSHEVGRATVGRTTTVRVVCANTLAAAEADRGEIHFRQHHGKAFDIETAKEQVGEAHEQLRLAESQAKILAGLKIKMQDAVDKVLLPVFSPDFEMPKPLPKGKTKRDMLPRPIRKIMESIETAPGAIPDNGWGILNGVTHWADHVAGNAQDTRLASAWTGQNMRRKLEVEKKLLELAS